MHRGEKVTLSTFTASQLAGAIDSGVAELPFNRYLYDDFMRPTKVPGGYACPVGANGEHGDTFDGTKLSFFGWSGYGAAAEAMAVSITSANERRTAKNEDEFKPQTWSC